MEAKVRQMSSEIFETAVLPAIEAGGSFQLTVTGSSMAPTLHAGEDAVLLEKAEAIQTGDILLFRRSTGAYILHRCIRIRGDRLTMNGDAQSWTEEISKSQVCAKAVKLRRAGKWEENRPLYAALWPLTRKLRPLLLKIRTKLR